ncbi:VC1465 family Xer recombination activation factor [Xylophilus ampelinus]
MYRGLGLDLDGCAQMLRVSRRTIHNWQSGRHEIPYAVYRLVRLLGRMDLPGESWSGWSFVAGKLVSPEGHAFVGTDSSWWSLLVRRARLFDVAYREAASLRVQLAEAWAAAAGGATLCGGCQRPPPALRLTCFLPFAPMIITGITHVASLHECSPKSRP